MGTVEIDDRLYDRVAERVEASSFDDVEEYVTFVLETVTADHLALGEATGGDRQARSSEEVEENLRSLGYLE